MTREEIIDLQRAYQLMAGSPAGQMVLAHLAGFCRATATCVVIAPDQRLDRDRTLVAEGRREVWLRIRQFIDTPIDELMTQEDSHGEAPL